MSKTDYGSLIPTTESDTRIFHEKTQEATEGKDVESPTDSWGFVKRDPVVNTVFAELKQKTRRVEINPSEIEKSLENLKRNEDFERRGLG